MLGTALHILPDTSSLSVLKARMVSSTWGQTDGVQESVQVYEWWMCLCSMLANCCAPIGAALMSVCEAPTKLVLTENKCRMHHVVPKNREAVLPFARVECMCIPYKPRLVSMVTLQVAGPACATSQHTCTAMWAVHACKKVNSASGDQQNCSK